MGTHVKTNGFIDVSTAGDEEDPDTWDFYQNLCQNLTKFNIVN